MKTRLSSILLLLLCAMPSQALDIPSYHMDTLVLLSDVVVYCEEKEVQAPPPSKTGPTHCKCKVLQTFKGDIAPGSDLTVVYDFTFERMAFGSAYNRATPHNFPPGKALLFLHKDASGSYSVVDAKLVQEGKVYQFIQDSNPGLLYPLPAHPESIKLENDEEYGEKELLQDFAIALKKSASLKEPQTDEWIRYDFQSLAIAHSPGEDAETKSVVKAAKNDVEIEVSIPAVVKSGDSVKMLVRLINNSKQRLSCLKVNDIYELGIKVVDANNKPVELTQQGLSKISGFPNAINERQIEPGQFYEFKVDLARYFKLGPGKYAASVTIDSLAVAPGTQSVFTLSVSGVNFEIK
jgi:hypothetical protein